MKRFILFAWTVSISAAWGAVERPRPATPPVGVSITLVGRAADLGMETVNFGLPLAPGFRSDPDLVRVYDAAGAEIEAAVRPLEPWRIDGRKGTIRSLQIQFRADFRRLKTQRIKVAFDQKRRQKPGGSCPCSKPSSIRRG